MAIQKVLRKLRRASFPEIYTRSQEAVRTRLERLGVCGRQGTIRNKNDVCFAKCCAGLLGVDFTDWLHVGAKSRESIVHRAQELTDNRVAMLGVPLRISGRMDWHCSPGSPNAWPKVFYADVFASRQRPAVDVKFTWEFSRHQFLVDLAKAGCVTGDWGHVERAREIVLDWIDCNPPLIGVNWTSALELAIRSISWILTLGITCKWSGWTEIDEYKICRSLADHADYLANHLSYYSSPYNHLIGEATGLYLIGCALEGRSPHASRWRQLSQSVLQQHTPKQFYQDGFTVEQAVAYHFFTLGFLSLAVLAMRQMHTADRELEETVKQAFVAGKRFQRPDGFWPPLGDLDSARAIPNASTSPWDFGSLCNLAAVMFSEPALKCGDTPGEEVEWLLGREGVDQWKKIEPTPSTGFSFLQDSGYVIAKLDSHWLLFDGGPVAEGLHPDATPSVAHGHADTFQILYSHGNDNLLDDSGISSYFGPTESVEHFRSAAAHNTLEVEGVGPARSNGKLAWSHAALRPSLHACVDDSFVMIRGEANWADVLVQRHVLLSQVYGLWIADCVQCDSPRWVKCYWQLPVGSITSLESDPHVSAGMINYRLHASGNATRKLLLPTDASPVAQHAHLYNIVAPAQTLVIESDSGKSHVVLHHWGNYQGSLSFESRQFRLKVNALHGDCKGSEVLDLVANDTEVSWRFLDNDNLDSFSAGTAKSDSIEDSSNWFGRAQRSARTQLGHA